MTSTIDTGQPFYLQSDVGTTVLPDFQGGTLRIDVDGVTDNNDYAVGNVAGNTIDAFGNDIMFTGQFTGSGGLEFTDSTGGGEIILTGISSIGGAVTIDAGATVQWGNGNVAFIFGSSIVDNGTLRFDYGAGGGLSGNLAISGSGRVEIVSGLLSNSATCSYTGVTTIDATASLWLAAGGAIATSSLVADYGIFDISGATSGRSINDLTGSGLVKLGSKTLTITNALSSFSGVLMDGGNGGGTGGSLTIAGGTQTLTGTNTFTGTTTINSGATLQLAADGSLAGSIVDDGLVRFAYGGAVTVANNLSGSGNVEVASGTVVVTNFSIVGGTVTIDSGATLQWGNGGGAQVLLGTTGVVDNGSLFVDFGGGNVTYLKPISGSGSVTVQSGTFGETEVNTYTGSTTIASGAQFVLEGTGSIANSSVVADNGTFDISHTSGTSIVSLTGAGLASLGAQNLMITNASGTFSGVLADGGLAGGTGATLTVAGGTETLSGTNTFTGATMINSGATLQLGAGGTTGTVAGNIVDNGLVRFAYSGPVTVGNFSGSGNVEVASGTVVATAFSASVSGRVTIDSGAILQWGNGGTGSLTAGVGVVDNGSLVVDFGVGNLTYFRSISGSGGIRVQSGFFGEGRANTYTGSTVIDSGGTFSLAGIGSIANSSVVADNGIFDISGTSGGASITRLTGSGLASLGARVLTITGASGTFSGVLADGGHLGGTHGGLTIAGGTQILTGTNTFTGNTSVATGATLQLGNGGTTGSVAGLIALANNATLAINHSAGISESFTIRLGFGGDDTFTGGASNGTFDFGATLRADDSINGAGGTDTVKLTGDYSSGLIFQTTTLLNVENLVLGAGFNYGLTTDEATVAAGKLLTVDASALGATNALTFNGGAETNGAFDITGGSGGDTLTGGTGNDDFTGRGGGDVFNPGLGNDVVNGGAGNDIINFFTPGGFTAADQIDGSTDNDTLNLMGDYAAGVTFNATTLVNVEKIVLFAGFSYSLTTHNATVAAGQLLTVDGSTLAAGQTLTFNGAAETNGRFTIKGGVGNDVLTGGGADDIITGSKGDDTLNGGAGINNITGGAGADTITVTAGTDTLVYTTVSQSTRAGFDTISHFDFLNNDHFDLDVAVTGIDTRVSSGTLNTATFDSDLAAAIGASQLAAHHAVYFDATAGTAVGRYLIVDADGTAGYQTGHDYVFLLTNSVHDASLDVTDFI